MPIGQPRERHRPGRMSAGRETSREP